MENENASGIGTQRLRSKVSKNPVRVPDVDSTRHTHCNQWAIYDLSRPGENRADSSSSVRKANLRFYSSNRWPFANMVDYCYCMDRGSDRLPSQWFLYTDSNRNEWKFKVIKIRTMRVIDASQEDEELDGPLVKIGGKWTTVTTASDPRITL